MIPSIHITAEMQASKIACAYSASHLRSSFAFGNLPRVKYLCPQ